MIKNRLTAALTAFCLCFGLAAEIMNFGIFAKDEVFAKGEILAKSGGSEMDYNGVKVAYVPIDNRPVNKERAEYLAASAGVELILPPEDLYRTALDNMTPNENGTTYGDREAIVNWLKSIDSECDYFVLSLDQLLSGGLVTSRWFSNSDLSFEYEIADYIASLSENNTVVLFDTVMRLASTVNYQGYQSVEYDRLRVYGAAARQTLSPENLSVQNIIDGYRYDENGEVIQSSLPNEKIEKYLSSRERKLKLIDYVLENALDNIDFCFIGVDDSSNGVNIQTNEINYIRSKTGDKGACFAATDELGLMGITRVLSLLYGGTGVSVTYFGGAEDSMADGFDFETLRQNVNSHISSLNCGVTNEGETLSVLIFTNANHSSAAAALVARAASNIENNIPTVIIDPTYGSGNKALERSLANSGISPTMLLAYSNWNTAGNAMGLALSNGIARYLYLKRSANITEESHRGFLKAITFSFLKDISYKLYGFSINNPSSMEFLSYGYLLEKINSGKMIRSLSPYSDGYHETAVCSNFRYPWNRTFEMTFDISFKSFLPGDADLDGKVSVSDYILIKLAMLNLANLDGEAKKAADINGDGKLSSLDYIAVRLHLLGIKPLGEV
ncbi:MAG: DUF4127 family protein [Eubacteriales bacterium]